MPSSRKSISIGLVSVIILLAIGGLLYSIVYFSHPKTAGVILPPITLTPAPVRYGDTKFSFLLPVGWDASSRTMVSYEEYRLQSSEDDLIRVYREEYLPDEELEKRAETYINLGLQQSTITVNGTPATVWKGSVPEPGDDRENVNRVISMVIVRAPHGVYTVRYSYAAETQDPGKEMFFESFMNDIVISP